MRDICLYAFFSDGLYEFAETFVDSLKFHHGEDLHIILETLDLNDEQTERLRTSYENLDLRNRPIDLSHYTDLLDVGVETIRRWKHEVENVVTSNENYKWKILMSVEERYRSVTRIAAEAKAAGYAGLIHADIDLYFRRPLDDFIDIVRSHDVSIFFREGAQEKFRVLGAYMGFSLTESTAAFLNSWAAHIDSLKPKEKPRGFGQTSFYRAYLEHEGTCKWGRLDQIPKGPKISKNRDPEADIWIGNSNQGRNRKSRTAAIFAADLEEMKRDQKSFVGSQSYRLYHYPSYSREQRSPDFEQTLSVIRKSWVKALEEGAKIDKVQKLDIFFLFLTKINELLQLNLCQSMTDLGTPNPYRYIQSIILKDSESPRTYEGV